MTIVLKVVAVGIIFAIISVVLKQYRREYVYLLSLCVVIIILSLVIDEISSTIGEIYDLFKIINITHIKSLLKITGIAIIADIVCDVIDESGEKAVSNVICIVVKFIILIYTLPMLKEIISFCNEILNK